MNAAGVALGERHRLLTRCCRKYVVAVSLEHGLNDTPHSVFIFHQQDRFRSARYGASPGWFHWFSSLVSNGEIYVKSCALPWFRLYPNVTAALLDDAVAGGKPEAGAVLFSRKERLEQSREHLCIHAKDGVLHR